MKWEMMYSTDVSILLFIAIRDVGDIVKEMYGNSPPSVVIMGHR